MVSCRVVTLCERDDSSSTSLTTPTSHHSPTTKATLPTALYDMHLSLKGKMVPFAGYTLPVLYETEAGGVMNEHLHCRSEGKSSLFDVSHMGQIRWRGADRVAFLEKVLVGDIAGLGEGEGRLSLITTNEVTKQTARVARSSLAFHSVSWLRDAHVAVF